MTSPAKKKIPVGCRFFERGHCFKGDNCNFLHLPSTMRAGASGAESRQGRIQSGPGLAGAGLLGSSTGYGGVVPGGHFMVPMVGDMGFQYSMPTTMLTMPCQVGYYVDWNEVAAGGACLNTLNVQGEVQGEASGCTTEEPLDANVKTDKINDRETKLEMNQRLASVVKEQLRENFRSIKREMTLESEMKNEK